MRIWIIKTYILAICRLPSIWLLSIGIVPSGRIHVLSHKYLITSKTETNYLQSNRRIKQYYIKFMKNKNQNSSGSVPGFRIRAEDEILVSKFWPLIKIITNWMNETETLIQLQTNCLPKIARVSAWPCENPKLPKLEEDMQSLRASWLSMSLVPRFDQVWAYWAGFAVMKDLIKSLSPWEIDIFIYFHFAKID